MKKTCMHDMTMPHLMNCEHSADGWCLDCVVKQHGEVTRLRAALTRARADTQTLHMVQSINNQNQPAAWHDAVDAALEAIDASMLPAA